MEVPQTSISSAKKLVQARLPFQVFRTTNNSEPPRKKLALTAADNESGNNENVEINRTVSDIRPIDLSPDKLEVIECQDTGKKKKRDYSDDEKMSKKVKLDVKSLLGKFASPKNVERSSEIDKESVPFIEVKSDNQLGDPAKDSECIFAVEEKTQNDIPETEANQDEVESDADESIEPTRTLTGTDREHDLQAGSTVAKEAEEEEEEAIIEEVTVLSEEETEIDKYCSDSPGVKPIETPPSKMSVPRKKTPKQLEKQLEAAKRREEREKERLEIAKRKEEKEKLRKEKEVKKLMEKKAKEESRMLKKKELEEKGEMKKRAKEDKERRKQQEIEIKNEEKRRKEEEKEKKRKEENKFVKEAAVFTNFFTKEKTRKSEGVSEIKELVVFKPFAVKNRMRLAPINRNPIDDARKSALDEALVQQDLCKTYLTELRCGDIKLGKSGNTWPLDDLYQDDDTEVEELPTEDIPVITCNNSVRGRRGLRAKLLQFAENRRPPYWGTWRAKCSAIRPRRPFGLYKAFEYDVDSDEEWEEEEPGESLHGSDDEKDKEEDGEDDYEVDNDLFVPHGYLSEDEAQPDETWSVEQQKEKLKLLGEQFDHERNEKTKKLRPVVIGCVWSNASLETNKIPAVLLRCQPWFSEDVEAPIAIKEEEPDSPDVREGREADGASPAGSARRMPFPEEATADLLIRLHGAVVRRVAIAKEFAMSWAKDHPTAPVLSVAAVNRKVRELAQWQECPEPPLQGRKCWFVPRSVREQYGCGDLQIPARELTRETPKMVNEEGECPNTPKITKFTKVLTEEERRQTLKQLKPQAQDSNPECERANPITNQDVKADMSTSNSVVEKALQKLNQFRAPNTIPKKKVAILFSSPCRVPIDKTLTNNSTQTIVDKTSARIGEEPAQIVAPKKKVPILFSTPRGVPIDKSKPLINVENIKTFHQVNFNPSSSENRSQEKEPLQECEFEVDTAKNIISSSTSSN